MDVLNILLCVVMCFALMWVPIYSFWILPVMKKFYDPLSEKAQD